MSLVISWLRCNVIAFVMTLNGSGVRDPSHVLFVISSSFLVISR